MRRHSNNCKNPRERHKRKNAQANRRNRTQSRAKRTTNKCGHFATVRPPYMAWDPLAHGLRADFCLLDYAKLKG